MGGDPVHWLGLYMTLISGYGHASFAPYFKYLCVPSQHNLKYKIDVIQLCTVPLNLYFNIQLTLV